MERTSVILRHNRKELTKLNGPFIIHLASSVTIYLWPSCSTHLVAFLGASPSRYGSCVVEGIWFEPWNVYKHVCHEASSKSSAHMLNPLHISQSPIVPTNLHRSLQNCTFRDMGIGWYDPRLEHGLLAVPCLCRDGLEMDYSFLKRRRLQYSAS
jgi:hypothetical protein